MPDASSHSTFSIFPKSPTQNKSCRRTLLAVSLLAIAIPAAAQTAGTYAVTNLVSDGSVPATITDPNFINPSGITNATFWINAQATGCDYVISRPNFPPSTPNVAHAVTHPAPPAGHVSYPVHVIGHQVLVAYALRATAGVRTNAPSDGMANVFDTNRNFVAHAPTPGGNLNGPWGIATAP